MLVKFQSSSNRVKNCSFHPTQPLLLIALHNGSVQLYNYLLGTLINTFYAHNGPVRGISFHPKQPMFVSGGDDYLIKIFNFKTNNQPGVLLGHLDYIRSVYFHDELSWIISASDDQTLRVWNYMNRTCIAILTGHNHYCMHAAFTPSSYGNYIVSCSLDQTLRIWDYTTLKNKHTTNTSSITLGDSFQMDCTVKFVLEGHDRGVNWISVHPTQPLIVSGADDRQVKVWRISDSRAWELSSFRGHYNNVSSACFHPFLDLVLSNSEDKSIRVWDLNKRIMVNTFKRDNDRFWCMTPHPTQALFAAGHDSGVLVFKLQRERPASCHFEDKLFIVKNQSIVQFDLNTQQEQTLCAYKNTAKFMHYNPIEQSILLVNEQDSLVEQIHLNSQQQNQYSAINGVYISRNRLCLLNLPKNKLLVKEFNNDEIKKEIPLDTQVINLVPSGTGHVLVLSTNKVQLIDVLQNQIVAELTCQCKYAVWNSSLEYVALISKHAITICDRQLQIQSILHETLRIKSAIFHNNILIYCTLNHLKYALLNGDSGLLQTVLEPLYLMCIKDNKCFCFTRNFTLTSISIDPTEFLFKQALVSNDLATVHTIINEGNLVGQAIIKYLQQHHHQSIALEFVKDPPTRFELAIESNDLQIALQVCEKLNTPFYWHALGQEAIKMMDSKLAEYCYQKSKSIDQLQFLYLINNHQHLHKCLTLHDKDPSRKYQTALLLNDVDTRLQLLLNAKQYALAYCLAKSHNLQDIMDQCLAHAPSSPSIECRPLNTIPMENEELYVWPLKDKEYQSDPISHQQSHPIQSPIKQQPQNQQPQKQQQPVEQQQQVEEWGDIEELLTTPAPITDKLQVQMDFLTMKAKSSSDAIEHCRAGLFDSAISLLYNQYGIIDFKPLQPYMLQLYTSSHFSISMGFNELQVGTDATISISLETMLTEAHQCTTNGQFEEGLHLYKKIIYSGLFTKKSYAVLHKAMEYCRGLTVELKRREGLNEVQLALEFTKLDLDINHLSLALRSLMSISFKQKCFKTCMIACERLLEMNPPEQIAVKVFTINVD